ncbi:bifunctional glutamate N-acetyltransferase/amino-acid acetyltransferase ArgJ [Lentisphaerota bacterium WC36G]|nr:bifunctional glutamate N-acetyltransferase/amino-acid acetyltransferase ArgJ [Lentisphaerae bacterium WC36]
MSFQYIKNGGVASAKGFKAVGVTAGIKVSGKPDMSLIFSESPANFAGVFTTCSFAAAPVRVCQKRVKEIETVQAIIVNSGNANACTGVEGIKNAELMCERIAAKLDLPNGASDVLVSSTGRIGVQLDFSLIDHGIDLAIKAIKNHKYAELDNNLLSAEAIMTTDTVPKYCAVEVTAASGKKYTIGAMTKGAGMIDPEMKAVPHATMLCYVVTDAQLNNQQLTKLLGDSAEKSFNCINIDGDMSTNDTMLILANGTSGVAIDENSQDEEIFATALDDLSIKLAKEMVIDGEGVTKLVTIDIEGANNDTDAKQCANAIANSLLCKTAWFGGDPNWGRVIAAAGYSKVDFVPEDVKMYYDEYLVVENGMPTDVAEEVLAKEVLAKDNFTVRLVLGNGKGKCRMWTNDISYEYVKINAEYHT